MAYPAHAEKTVRKTSVDEILDTREDFSSLSWNDKNCFMLGKLRTFRHFSQEAKTGRTVKQRQRQRFHYRIEKSSAFWCMLRCNFRFA